MRRSRTDEGLLSHKALQALAMGAPAPVATLVLRNVLRDARAPRADRVTAARLLGTIGTKEAWNVLDGAIRDRHPRVRQAVFASLGQIGEPTDLKKLRQLADSDDRHTARQLEFARALIAHRHGLDGPFLAAPFLVERTMGPSEQMIELTLKAKTAKAMAGDMLRWKGTRYGIEFGQAGFALRAGRAEWTVFVNGALGQSANTLSPIFERPYIAAVLARWNAEHLALHIQYVALTRPDGKSVSIVVVRGDGEVMYTGTADLIAGNIAYAMSDIDRPGTAPTNVRGIVGRAGLEITVAVPFGSRVGTRATLDVTGD